MAIAMTNRDDSNRLRNSAGALGGDDWPALRGGEIAVELPSDADASVYFIGRW